MTAAQVIQHMSAYRTRLVLAFAAIYLIWGSTYLAIRFAIETIPPMLMGGVRFGVAGGVLYLWSRFNGRPRPSWSDIRSAALIGALMVVGGNGSVIWAEQFIASGLAAVLVATGPLWLVLFDWAMSGRKRLSVYTIVGLILGFTGVVALSLQSGTIETDGAAQSLIFFSAGLLTFGAAAWALGSMFARRLNTKTSLPMMLSLQMTLGGGMLLALGTVMGEWSGFAINAVSTASMASLAYLIVMGTLVAFSAYVWLMRVSTPEKVGTHGYVNPIVAVFLGWWLASEPVTAGTLVATATILVGVALINLPMLRKLVQGRKTVPFDDNQKLDPDMIARTWHGVVPAEKEEEYLDYIKKTGYADATATKGNQGVFVLTRRESDKTHFVFLSLWESMDAIRAFVGNETERARYYPEDSKYLLELEPGVEHYDVSR